MGCGASASPSVMETEEEIFVRQFMMDIPRSFPTVAKNDWEQFAKIVARSNEVRKAYPHSQTPNDVGQSAPMNAIFPVTGPPRLYLGSIKDRETIAQEQKDFAILDCASTEHRVPKPQNQPYMGIPAIDGELTLWRYFDAATEFLHDCDVEKRTVLVHCFAGISRSVTFVIAYGIRYLQWTPLLGYLCVLQRRDVASPVDPFVVQLIHYWNRETILRDLFLKCEIVNLIVSYQKMRL